MEQGDKYTEEEKKRKKRNQEKDIKTDAWISGCDGSNNPTEQRPLSNNRRVFFLNLKHVAINGSSPVRILFVTCILIAFFFFWIFLSQIKRFFTFTFAQLPKCGSIVTATAIDSIVWAAQRETSSEWSQSKIQASVHPFFVQKKRDNRAFLNIIQMTCSKSKSFPVRIYFSVLPSSLLANLSGMCWLRPSNRR